MLNTIVWHILPAHYLAISSYSNSLFTLQNKRVKWMFRLLMRIVFNAKSSRMQCSLIAGDVTRLRHISGL